MEIVRRSPFSGLHHVMDLPVTQEQLDRWQAGELVQNVFPHLSADEREFLMTGITPQEWEEEFGLEE
tara:strand:- start:250 stop:450 length:201 start_codon:yes stop_codon:yes gene_type:complete